MLLDVGADRSKVANRSPRLEVVFPDLPDGECDSAILDTFHILGNLFAYNRVTANLALGLVSTLGFALDPISF
jgi:hypothetical protein